MCALCHLQNSGFFCAAALNDPDVGNRGAEADAGEGCGDSRMSLADGFAFNGTIGIIGVGESNGAGNAGRGKSGWTTPKDGSDGGNTGGSPELEFEFGIMAGDTTTLKSTIGSSVTVEFVLVVSGDEEVRLVGVGETDVFSITGGGADKDGDADESEVDCERVTISVDVEESFDATFVFELEVLELDDHQLFDTVDDCE